MARVDVRLDRLLRRVRRGDIAIVDRLDLDRVSAEALVEKGAVAVVNAAASISGRYPSLGAAVLVAAGVPLVDQVGDDVFGRVRDGDRVRVDGGVLYRGRVEVARGVEQTPELVETATVRAGTGLAAQLEAFAANTAAYLRRYGDLLLDGAGMPQIGTDLRGRQVLIVVHGYDHRADLARLRPYIREHRPVLVGVDGGADALLDAAYRPDLIVHSPDSTGTDPATASERALRCGAEVIVPVHRAGPPPDLGRPARLASTVVTVPGTGCAEDTAVLLAEAKGAELIVLAGAARTLVELLDKGREGMAGAVLTRLRAAGRLTDAETVSRVYRTRVRPRHLVMLLLSGMLALVAALSLAVGPAGVMQWAAWWETVATGAGDVVRDLGGWSP